MQLVVLILRDDAYGMIRWKQSNMGLADYGLTYGNPDFVKYAESYRRPRLPGRTVQRIAQADDRVSCPRGCACDRSSGWTIPRTIRFSITTFSSSARKSKSCFSPAIRITLPANRWRRTRTSRSPTSTAAKSRPGLPWRMPTPSTRGIAAAADAADPMRRLRPYQRQQILHHCVDRFEERFDELAMSLCIEAGKPIKDARGEVSRLIDTFRIAAEESVRLGGEVMNLEISPRADGYRGMFQRVPIGPCSFISPFNFPLNLAAHKNCPSDRGGLSVCAQAGQPHADRSVVDRRDPGRNGGSRRRVFDLAVQPRRGGSIHHRRAVETAQFHRVAGSRLEAQGDGRGKNPWCWNWAVTRHASSMPMQTSKTRFSG